jgi:NAD(P)H-hydrate epimerase
MHEGRTLFSRDQARAYDAHCIAHLGIPGILLMECAACGIAAAAMRAASAGAGAAPLFVAVCGPGQNGGDGYAAVRHLHSAGMDAVALETSSPRAGTDAELEHRLASRLGLVQPYASAASRIETGAATRRTVMIDALFGIGLDRPVAGHDAVRVLWIASMRERGATVIAVDLPSGMDCDTGEALGGVCVEADITVTMVAPKLGMANPAAARRLGTVIPVPIGGPPAGTFLSRHGMPRDAQPGTQAQSAASA